MKRGLSGVVFLDDSTIVTGGRDGTIRIWSTTNLDCTQILEQEHRQSIGCIAVDAANNLVVSGSLDGNVHIWDLSSSTARTIDAHSRSVNGIDISASNEVVTASEDKLVKVWDMATLELRHTLRGHTQGQGRTCSIW